MEESEEVNLCADCPDEEEIILPVRKRMNWNAGLRVEKYRGEKKPGDRPYEVIESEGNALTDAGIQYVLDRIIGAGSATVFNNANAHLGVGNGTTAFAASQTDLQGASKHREPMDATYPSRAANVVTAVVTFETGDANFAWQEWGFFNAVSAGTMLNRKVQSFGTKTSADTWVATATLSGS